jgi:HemY protein
MLFKAVYIFLIVLFWSVAGVYLANNSGEVDIVFLDYKITMSFPVFFILSFVLVYAFVFLIRGYKKLKGYILFLMGKRVYPVFNEKGYDLLAKSQYALSKGDVAHAKKLAERAEVMLLESPYSLINSAQIMDAIGREKDALKRFKKMAENPNTAMMGLKGLFEYTYTNDKYDQAYSYVKKAYAIDRRHEWVLKGKLDLELKKFMYEKAMKTLDLIAKYKMMPKGEVLDLRAVVDFENVKAMLLDSSDEATVKKAKQELRKILSDSAKLTQAAKFYAEIYVLEKDYAKALDILESNFKKYPTYDVAREALRVIKVQAKDAGISDEKAYKALEDFSNSNKKVIFSDMIKLKAAVEFGLYDKAAALIKSNEKKLGIYQEFLRLKADYLDNAGGSPKEMKAVLHDAIKAKELETFECKKCKFKADEWHTFCPNCSAFGSLYIIKTD